MGIDELVRGITPNEDDEVRVSVNGNRSIKFGSPEEAIKYLDQRITNGHIEKYIYQTEDENRLVGYEVVQDADVFSIHNANFPYD